MGDSMAGAGLRDLDPDTRMSQRSPAEILKAEKATNSQSLSSFEKDISFSELFNISDGLCPTPPGGPDGESTLALETHALQVSISPV